MKNRGLIIIALICLVGIIVTNYMTYNHFAYKQNPKYESGCKWLSFQKEDKCREVALSKYSEMFGMPVSFWGIFFFLSLFIFSLSYIFLPDFLKGFPNLLLLCSSPGVLAYLYLTYLELFVIKVVCPLCIFTSIITLFTFLISLKFRGGNI